MLNRREDRRQRRSYVQETKQILYHSCAYFISFWLVLILVAPNLFYSILPPEHRICSDEEEKKLHSFYSLIIGSYNATSRSDWAMKNWIPRFKASPYEYKMVLVTDGPNSYNPEICERIILNMSYLEEETRKFPQMYETSNRKEVHKVLKLKAGIDDFYYNTNLSWFKNEDDDAALYFPNFIKFIDSHSIRHNPHKDIIIRGCCMRQHKYHFAQGGTGLLFSRAAIKHFLRHWDDFYRRMDTYEDRHMFKYILSTGIRPKEISSTYFTGDPFARNHNASYFIELRNFSILQTCPIFHRRNRCAHTFYKLNMVASYHRYWELPNLADALDEGLIPDWVRFYDHSLNPRMCKMPDNRIEIEYIITPIIIILVILVVIICVHKVKAIILSKYQYKFYLDE